ncbi:MAG: radical SAM protein [Pseudomonadota bacterium]
MSRATLIDRIPSQPDDAIEREPVCVPPAKFREQKITVEGAPRAHVSFQSLKTLWVNTGTLCNLACTNCYIESTPKNDALVYLTRDELAPFLDEARAMGCAEVGFTGGEPFLNPEMPVMLEATLAQGFSALVLTNAMTPMMRPHIQGALKALGSKWADRFLLRVSLDHYTAEEHDRERGEGAFEKAMAGIHWLINEGFKVSIAGRSITGEALEIARNGFANLFTRQQIPLDAHAEKDLVIFPEMDAARDTPEISEACWNITGARPDDMMCATSRMVVKRKGAKAPSVLACTLIAYDTAFELGGTLSASTDPVYLNHPHCSRFCVLGGASCSG